MSDQNSTTDQHPDVSTGEPTNVHPPFPPDVYLDPIGPVLGSYHATLELATLQGAIVNARVTVEGSALVVEQVLAAAAVAFREDAER